MPIEILAPVIVALLTAAGIIFGWFAWLFRQFQQWRHRGPEPFPVRLTCKGDTDFHPSAGFREGVHIEVYNESGQAVHIKGFGLEFSMRAQGSWKREEFVSGHPRNSFPKWLRARESFDGYIDAEALSDQLYMEGENRYITKTHAFVDVSGYDRHRVDASGG